MKTILIIDDNQLIRFTTSLLLKQNGMTSICAASGQEGLDMLEQTTPSLILLDIMMPIMDGWQVLERIQANPAHKEIPVIVFTAMENTFSISTAKERGAVGLLQKPFTLEELLASINQCIPGGVHG